ncbi:hypothetical protein L1887_29421 [Cichorium endivia]|nr:hypothetical protein L1887_29421 [Cichorium endivia]
MDIVEGAWVQLAMGAVLLYLPLGREGDPFCDGQCSSMLHFNFPRLNEIGADLGFSIFDLNGIAAVMRLVILLVPSSNYYTKLLTTTVDLYR